MIIDSIVIGIVLVSAIVSFLRGFIREILTIFGVLGGVIAAYLFGSTIEGEVYNFILPADFKDGDKLFGMIPFDMAATVIAFGGLFILVVVALSILSHFLAESASEYGLGAVDRTLGVFFGLARGALIVGLLYLPVFLFLSDDDKGKWFKESQTIVYVDMTSDYLASFIPGFDEGKENDENLAKAAAKKIDVLKDEMKEKIEKEVTSTISKEAEGYKDEARNNLDNLIEQQIVGEDSQTILDKVKEAVEDVDLTVEPLDKNKINE